MGRVLPNDLEQLTLDQFLITWLSSDEFGIGKTTLTPEEAAAKGFDVDTGKSGTEMARERAAKRRRQEARASSRGRSNGPSEANWQKPGSGDTRAESRREGRTRGQERQEA